MLQIQVGTHIDMSQKRTGARNDGQKWCMVKVAAEKGYDSITLWVENAEQAERMNSAEITEIRSVAVKHTKKGDKWYTDYSCNVVVRSGEMERQQNRQAANAFDEAINGFMPVPDNLADEGLPFN